MRGPREPEVIGIRAVSLHDAVHVAGPSRSVSGIGVHSGMIESEQFFSALRDRRTGGIVGVAHRWVGAPIQEIGENGPEITPAVNTDEL